MEQKVIAFQNKGMTRDLSISKVNNEFAYENFNIRITPRDHDTLFSVTNEKGNRQINIIDEKSNTPFSIKGVLLGYSVLNSYLVLFTKDESSNIDYIYRITYNSIDDWKGLILYKGDLNFSTTSPIETLANYESEDIQKIYWTDGLNQPRFINIVADEEIQNSWNNSSFNFVSEFNNSLNVDIIKKYNGIGTFPSGTIQYFITYYNQFGQETNLVYQSSLLYLTDYNKGLSPEDNSNCSFELSLSNIDTTFQYVRVYSVINTTLNGTPQAYIVGDYKISGSSLLIVDSGNNRQSIDPTSLYFVGGHIISADTMTQKDNTLFLGNINIKENKDYKELENLIKEYCFLSPTTGMQAPFVENESYESAIIAFEQDYGVDFPESTGVYQNNFQLNNPSSTVKIFKGGEKYRFAIQFISKEGIKTKAFWIGDKVNNIYPEISNNKIVKAKAVCRLPYQIKKYLQDKYDGAILLMAEPTMSDKSILAQGIVNPTVFNMLQRYNDSAFAIPSWIMRAKNSFYSYKHFTSLGLSKNIYGEIQCNDYEELPSLTYEKEGDDIAYYRYIIRIEAFYSGVTYKSKYSFRVAYYKADSTLSKEEEIEITPLSNWFSTKASYLYLKTWWENYNLPTADMPTYEFFDSVEIYFRERLLGSTIYHSNAMYYNGLNPPVIVDATMDPIPENIIPQTSDEESEYWSPKFQLNYDGGTGNSYVYNHKNDYYIDESILTLNSPDLENNGGLIDNNDGIKFRIVGIADITASTTKYNANISNTKDLTGNLLNINFSKYNTNPNSTRYCSYPLWEEGGNIFPLYLFHKEGSIIGETSDNNIKYSELETKIIANLNFSNKTIYFDNFWNNKVGINTPRYIIDNDTSYIIKTPFGEKVYQGKYDYLLTQGLSNEEDQTINSYNIYKVGLYKEEDVLNLNISDYEIYQVPDSENVDETTQLINKKVSDPIRVQFNTTPHIVFSLKENDNTFNTLPYLSDTEVSNISSGYLPFNTQDNWFVLNTFNTLFYIWSNSYTDIIYPFDADIDDLNLNISYDTIVKDLESYDLVYILIEFIPDFKPIVIKEKGNILFEKDSSGNAILRNYKEYILLGENPEYIKDIRYDRYFHHTYIDGEFRLNDLLINPYVYNSDKLDIEHDSQYSYLFIGELYRDFEEGNKDSRYGGISESAINNNKFIPCGKYTDIKGGIFLIEGTEGDCFFQRYDCLKTYSYSEESVNGIIDVTSVMLETYQNLDGRYDLYRNIELLLGITPENTNQINPVYSQNNNFISANTLPDKFNLSTYPTQLTWSLSKNPTEDIDSWTKVTLTSTLDLDGDKGPLRALRRFNNSIISFQDKGIAEILFNTRTQLSTTQGIPIEIANSNKVDGKRYITDKAGCINKWSIIETTNGIYFIDNINSSINIFNGGIQSLSDVKGFKNWIGNNNLTNVWNPKEFNNFISFWDRVNDDVYFLNNKDSKNTLCYNELIQQFTSFFDYGNVPMMVNVQDRFIAFKDNKLWLQGEGQYNNIFGSIQDYYVLYRVSPDPYGDKIFTNLEYRADLFDMNNVESSELGTLTDNTFSKLKVWNEYQENEIDLSFNIRDVYTDNRRKFRIWRTDIPRDKKNSNNRFGLNRIRNPWIYLRLSKNNPTNNERMEFHNLVIKYFE